MILINAFYVFPESWSGSSFPSSCQILPRSLQHSSKYYPWIIQRIARGFRRGFSHHGIGNFCPLPSQRDDAQRFLTIPRDSNSHARRSELRRQVETERSSEDPRRILEASLTGFSHPRASFKDANCYQLAQMDQKKDTAERK